MRADVDKEKNEDVVVLFVYQQEIRPDMAFSGTGEFPGELVISESLIKRLTCSERINDNRDLIFAYFTSLQNASIRLTIFASSANEIHDYSSSSLAMMSSCNSFALRYDFPYLSACFASRMSISFFSRGQVSALATSNGMRFSCATRAR